MGYTTGRELVTHLLSKKKKKRAVIACYAQTQHLYRISLAFWCYICILCVHLITRAWSHTNTCSTEIQNMCWTWFIRHDSFTFKKKKTREGSDSVSCTDTTPTYTVFHKDIVLLHLRDLRSTNHKGLERATLTRASQRYRTSVELNFMCRHYQSAGEMLYINLDPQAVAHFTVVCWPLWANIIP